MSTAMPQIPPRPTRSVKETASTIPNMPKVPPRPTRHLDRSISRERESFARSPLNETTFLSNQSLGKPLHGNSNNTETSSPDAPARPLSVVLPSLGQEGNEYATAFAAPKELETSPTQLRNIANDLKLYAPKPSLPTASAKQQVSTVTRTDSSQAAAFGIGKANSDDKDPFSRPLKAKASFASQRSEGTERPPSSLDGEHGIPEIGQRVPMYPNAGDVQAPSPAPFAQPFTPGIGFHNDGSKPRHHGRRTSARDHDVPLEAYGRHGHQVIPHDRFEKAYYEKHPELFKKELGQYGEGRPEWAMSSEDLNKIVRDTASRGAGLGTSPAVMGTPTEQVGFQASEEYASRISSPRPTSSGYHIAHSNSSQTHVESPLRKTSFPADVLSKKEFENTLGRSLASPSDTALESEIEDDDVIHVDPKRRTNNVYEGQGRLDSTEDLEHNSGSGGGDNMHDEHGYGVPILASDEVAKEPFGYELQPAVSPPQDRQDESSFYHQKSSSQTSLSGSRPSSRPGSIHGTMAGLRLPSESAKLEDLEEYEPLFPEDETNALKDKPLTAVDRLKRPELKNRKFPSQDIWEDSPNSLQYTATVSTPQLPEDEENSTRVAQDETPEQAFARKQEELAEKEASEKGSFLHEEKEKKLWANKSHPVSETRPELKQRFPSRDIWEDTPDSLQLQTTVTGPQEPEKDVLSPPDERPTTGAMAYYEEKAAAGIPLGSEEGRATTGLAATIKPSIPARPIKSNLSQSPERSQPAIPERPRPKQSVDVATPPVPAKPKPVVPARPSKPLTRGSSENIPLSPVTSNTSAKSVGSDQGAAAASKSKPPVPSRPVGSKIAVFQGGFLSDLNKRLQLGPHVPKKEEPAPEAPKVEKEKVPLVDARKGRARGPARRAPATVPTEKVNVLGFSIPTTLWEIDPEEDFLHVATDRKDTAIPKKTAVSEPPELATNTAGESLHDSSKNETSVEKASSLPAVVEPQPQKPEELEKAAMFDTSEGHDIASLTASDEPEVALHSNLSPEPVEEEDMAGSTATLKASNENVD